MRYIIDDTTLAAIADAIRGKTGEEGPIATVDMANYIDNIRTSAKPILEGLTVTPTGKEMVEIPPFGSDGFGIVVIEGDDNLVASNIRNGVTIYGVQGILETEGGIDTSDATATSDDILDAATAYVNGEKVTGTHICVADPILSELFINPTGEELRFVPEEGTDGFGEVIVEACEELIPENILAGSTIYGVEGIVCFQEKEVTPTAENIFLEPDFGYTAFERVIVWGDSNLVPENIVQGVTIFDVEGTALSEEGLVEKKLQAKEVMPSFAEETVEPDEGCLGLSEVTVLGDPNLNPDNIVAGASIFGVVGTATTGTGDGADCIGHVLVLTLVYETYTSAQVKEVEKLHKAGNTKAQIVETTGIPAQIVSNIIANMDEDE